MPDVILVAPAAFKGTLGPRQVAEAISAGARRALPGSAVLQCPISDGGDGLLDAVLAPGSLREHLRITGPLGEPVSGELGWIDPEAAMLDGGWGLQARVVALADVTTGLVGPQGAAPVFAPQKGAGAEGVKLLTRGLERLGELMARHGRADLATLPGGGAAGGLGAGLAFFAKAQLLPGAEWVLSRVGFDAALAKAQLVITREGSFDRTSLVGKASGEVVRRAQAARKKVAVIAGRVEGLIGLHALDGEGKRLDATGIAVLAERAVRQAFGLPGA